MPVSFESRRGQHFHRPVAHQAYEQLVIGLEILHSLHDRVLRLHDLHGERAARVVRVGRIAIPHPSRQFGELRPVVECPAGKVYDHEALALFDECGQTLADLRRPQQRPVIREVPGVTSSSDMSLKFRTITS